MSRPLPFQGTPEEAAANFDTHRFIWSGPPEDAGDVRCDACDCRPSHQSAKYPCGADVPRIFNDGEDEVVLVEHTGTLEEFKAEMARLRERYDRHEEIVNEVDELLEPLRDALIRGLHNQPPVKEAQ